MKKYIFGLITGILLCSISVFAYNIAANEVTFKSKHAEFKAKSVSEALDYLYQKGGISTIEMSVLEKKKLTIPEGYRAVVEDPQIAEIKSDGTLYAIEDGITNVNIYKDEDKILTIKVNCKSTNFIILDGACYMNSTPTISKLNDSQKAQLKTYLTDGIKTQQGTYGALLHFPNYGYTIFKITHRSSIKFSSGYYADSGGTSGKKAYFYKRNNSGSETLYYELQTQINSQDYGEYIFEPGEYALRVYDRYVTFAEFTITEVD